MLTSALCLRPRGTRVCHGGCGGKEHQEKRIPFATFQGNSRLSHTNTHTDTTDIKIRTYTQKHAELDTSEHTHRSTDTHRDIPTLRNTQETWPHAQKHTLGRAADRPPHACVFSTFTLIFTHSFALSYTHAHSVITQHRSHTHIHSHAGACTLMDTPAHS